MNVQCVPLNNEIIYFGLLISNKTKIHSDLLTSDHLYNISDFLRKNHIAAKFVVTVNERNFIYSIFFNKKDFPIVKIRLPNILFIPINQKKENIIYRHIINLIEETNPSLNDCVIAANFNNKNHSAITKYLLNIRFDKYKKTWVNLNIDPILKI